jgi:hypothetical protein
MLSPKSPHATPPSSIPKNMEVVNAAVPRAVNPTQEFHTDRNDLPTCLP